MALSGQLYPSSALPPVAWWASAAVHSVLVAQKYLPLLGIESRSSVWHGTLHLSRILFTRLKHNVIYFRPLFLCCGMCSLATKQFFVRFIYSRFSI